MDPALPPSLSRHLGDIDRKIEALEIAMRSPRAYSGLNDTVVAGALGFHRGSSSSPSVAWPSVGASPRALVLTNGAVFDYNSAGNDGDFTLDAELAHAALVANEADAVTFIFWLNWRNSTGADSPSFDFVTHWNGGTGPNGSAPMLWPTNPITFQFMVTLDPTVTYAGSGSYPEITKCQAAIIGHEW